MKTTLLMLWYTVLSFIFFGVLLFLPAGTFNYWQAWVFIAVFLVGTMVPTIYLAVKYPDAFRRRTRSGPLAESRAVQKLINVGIIATTVAAGVLSALDHRFGWSTVPTAIVVFGNALVLLGLAIAELVVVQNNYAAATITVEKGQPVVSTGLYGVVRHPMYVGALIMTVGMPLALGSYWGLLTMIPALLVFGARITDEEKALREDLDGYTEYTEKVRYRLVPGVW
jgi:protein-S-isoprenylcysteine O-methyltransferase Ste14